MRRTRLRRRLGTRRFAAPAGYDNMKEAYLEFTSMLIEQLENGRPHRLFDLLYEAVENTVEDEQQYEVGRKVIELFIQQITDMHMNFSSSR